MSDPYELLDALGGDGRGDLTLPDQLRERACPAGKPWTANDPASDHGHTDCWLFHAAADEIERLRAVITEAVKTLEAEASDELEALRELVAHAWRDADQDSVTYLTAEERDAIRKAKEAQR